MKRIMKMKIRGYLRRKLSSLILWALDLDSSPIGLDSSPYTFNDDRWALLRLISQERSKSIHPKGYPAIGFKREANGELSGLTWKDGSTWDIKEGYKNRGGNEK